MPKEIVPNDSKIILYTSDDGQIRVDVRFQGETVWLSQQLMAELFQTTKQKTMTMGNWVVDYPFRLKDRCRMDTDDYVFQEQFGTGLLSTANGFQELDNWFAYVKTLPTIESELKQLPFPKNMAHSVYVIHMPPWRLGLQRSEQTASPQNFVLKNF